MQFGYVVFVIYYFVIRSFASTPWKKVYLESSLVFEPPIRFDGIYLPYSGTTYQKIRFIQTHPEVENLAAEVITFCTLNDTYVLATSIMASPLYKNQSEGMECFTNMNRDWTVGSTLTFSPTWNYPTATTRRGESLIIGFNNWKFSMHLDMRAQGPWVLFDLGTPKPIRKVFITRSQVNFVPQNIEVRIGNASTIAPFQQEVLPSEYLNFKRFGYRHGLIDLEARQTLKFQRKDPILGKYVLIMQRNLDGLPTMKFIIAYVQIF